MKRLFIGLGIALFSAAGMSAANPPWNPGGRTGTPTGIVAIPRPGWTQPVVGSTDDPAICNPVGVYSDMEGNFYEPDYCNIGVE